MFDNEPNRPNYMISWCGDTYSCKYLVFSPGKAGSDQWQDFEKWTIIHPADSIEVFPAHNQGGSGRYNLKVADIRLYRGAPSRPGGEEVVKMVYVTGEAGKKIILLYRYRYSKFFR
jgi:hypothetical protein